jgi:uncharacterized membrane protein (UPF0127 family)
MKKITTGWVIVGMLVLIGLYAWFLLRGGGEPSHYILTFPDGARIVAEIARSDAERFLGLIFKEKLPEDMGMLFIFDEPDRHRLWTKNARFPIDVVWLDSDRRVVGWEENLSPCRQDPCPTYAPQKPALYALEIPTGFVRLHGLKTDTEVVFELPKR